MNDLCSWNRRRSLIFANENDMEQSGCSYTNNHWMAPYIFLPIYLAKLVFFRKRIFLSHDIFAKIIEHISVSLPIGETTNTKTPFTGIQSYTHQDFYFSILFYLLFYISILLSPPILFNYIFISIIFLTCKFPNKI